MRDNLHEYDPIDDDSINPWCMLGAVIFVMAFWLTIFAMARSYLAI